METIRVERTGQVARIVLNRPEIRNAFDDVMIRELRQALAELGNDASLRLVVLTGEGKAFCAGADLHWMRRMLTFTYEENYADALELSRLLREIYDFPRPVVGRINGPAIGGGTGLVAACDIAVAAEDAVFGFSEVKIGLVPACIAPYLLKRVGERYVREYFMTGERLTAAKALECGLVNHVVPAAGLDAAIEQVVHSIIGSGPEALTASKRLVPAIGEMTLDEAGPFTAEVIARMRVGAEGQEGMSAFLERRKPRWSDGG
jgi:methylglutaconyl-CoA hydratase